MVVEARTLQKEIAERYGPFEDSTNVLREMREARTRRLDDLLGAHRHRALAGEMDTDVAIELELLGQPDRLGVATAEDLRHSRHSYRPLLAAAIVYPTRTWTIETGMGEAANLDCGAGRAH